MNENLREEFKLIFNTHNERRYSFFLKINFSHKNELLDFQIDFLSQAPNPFFCLDVIHWFGNNILSKSYYNSYEKYFFSEMSVKDILFLHKIKEKELLPCKMKDKNNAELIINSLKEKFKEYNDETISMNQLVYELIEIIDRNFFDQKNVNSECFGKNIENKIIKAEMEYSQFCARRISNNVA